MVIKRLKNKFGYGLDGISNSLIKNYRIRDTKLQLIKNYLSNRYQLTEVNGYKSKPLKIKTGVPQGSVLGPIFAVYQRSP